MITATANTTLLQARLLQVAQGVKGGLPKAIADSAGRIGVSLAKATFPTTDGKSRRDQINIGMVYPSAGRIYEGLKKESAMPPSFSLKGGSRESFALAMAKWFVKSFKEGNWEAVRKCFDWRGWKCTLAPKATLSDFLSAVKNKGYKTAGGFSSNFILLTGGRESIDALFTSLKQLSGQVSNGWVVASRFFRKARASDHIPAFKTKKQKIVTGSGRWEGTPEKPVAVLVNTFDRAHDAMTPGSFDRAVNYETKNLEKQIVNQARAAARKAKLGK